MEVNGYNVNPHVGAFIKPDGWNIGEKLTEGDNFSSFRIPTDIPQGIRRTIAHRAALPGWLHQTKRTSGLTLTPIFLDIQHAIQDNTRKEETTHEAQTRNAFLS